ncbi:MAG TPA: M23 family metallopeptidase [Bacteroidota bacterium]|nr:M23 family metallopeptidase [Bacteroidota bacterium]
MKQRRKLYYYSDENVSFVEARDFKLKFSGLLVVAVLGGLIVLFGINHYLGDVLGIDFDRAGFLTTENKLLKDEVKTLSTRLSDMSATMDKLAERDNELRLAVNLPKVDEDTRVIGVGGTVRVTNAGLVSKDASDLMGFADNLLDKLDREIAFERQSYQDIYKKSKYNKDFFAHIPAIKPMPGRFNYHDFGMRLHPILGIVRMHEGVDISNDVGTAVCATGDGVIESAGNTGGAYGVAVEVNHGYGYKTWYAHLLRPAVHVGQKVHRGDIIAYSGNTGLSTAPHLHYEVRLNGEKKNPVAYFIDDVDYKQIREQLALTKDQ